MITHLLDEDLLLVASGELSGPDLIHASEHIRACTECRERTSGFGSNLAAETFYEEIERTITLVESGRAPILDTLGRLQAMELALYAAGGAIEHGSSDLDRQRARVLFCQAWLLSLNGSLAPSRDAAIHAREISTSLGDEVQAARALTVEAFAVGFLRQTTAAIAAAREAAAIFVRHGEQRRARIARGTEASALVIADRPAEAAEIYRELLTVTEEDDPDRLHWLNDLAMCLLGLGELDQAEEIEWAVMASPAVEPDTAFGARWVCAVVQARRGNFEDALEQLRLLKVDAHMLAMRTFEVLASYSMAEIFSALDRPQEAATMAKQVIAYFTTEGIPSHARPAVALLREAVLLDSTDIFDELENVRRAFPELFPRVLALHSRPSRQIS